MFQRNLAVFQTNFAVFQTNLAVFPLHSAFKVLNSDANFNSLEKKIQDLLADVAYDVMTPFIELCCIDLHTKQNTIQE